MLYAAVMEIHQVQYIFYMVEHKDKYFIIVKFLPTKIDVSFSIQMEASQVEEDTLNPEVVVKVNRYSS